MIRKVARQVKQIILGTKPKFKTDDVQIGNNVRFGKNVVFNCQKVRIGDGTVFQDNIVINADVFEIGDYGTIYTNCFFPGPGSIKIGHNFWLGQSSIVDGMGGTTIGNNTGVGPHSQLWTHMKYGDVMYGNRFHSDKSLIIGQDVWLVGHCLVSPVNIGDRSMAFLGSLVTKDMEADHVYAGVPAKDITDKVGTQFIETTVEDRLNYLETKLADFAQTLGMKNDVKNQIKIVTSRDEMHNSDPSITVFNVADRIYTKRNTPLEYQLMKYLLPDAKFLPLTDTGK